MKHAQSLMTFLKELARCIDLRRDASVFCGLLALALALQWQSGAFRSDFGGHPDEPAHYVTGLMMRDYLVDAFGKHPLAYAENYYDHYPKVALGNWPPMFYVIQSAWTIPFGVSRESLAVLMALMSSLLAWLVFRALVRDPGMKPALAGAVLFLLLPLIQEHTALVMTEVPIALFVFLAALSFGRFLDHGRASDSILFGVFASLGILTKGSAMALALAVPLAMLLTRRRDLIMNPRLWYSVPIVVVLAGPWTWKFREQSKAGWVEQSPTWSFTQEALSYYPKKLMLAVGATLFVLALIGMLGRVRAMRGRQPGLGKWTFGFCVMASVLLAHFIIPCGYEPRHLIPALPFLVMFIMAGGEFLAAQFSVKALPLNKARTLVWSLALLAFMGSTFRLYQKGNEGFQAAAAAALRQAGDGTLLIASDATGEGAFIAEVAMGEKRPGHTVRRASKLLASSSWSGSGYEAKFKDAAELLAALEKERIDVVITDASMPEDKRMAHHTLLANAMDMPNGAFKLISTLDIRRSGHSHAGAVRIYRRAR